jgi:hypothetical protein
MVAMKRCLGLALMLAAVPACSAQAEPDYRGEPLAVLRGAIVTGERAAPGDVEAAVVWVSEPELDGWPIARVHVRGEFPAQFSVEVFDPPPEPAELPEMIQTDDARNPIAIGILAAIAPNSGDRVSYDEILGVWLDGGVQYFWRDANGEANDWVRNEAERRKLPPTKGYHLFRQTSDEQTEAESFRCQNWDLCRHDVLTLARGEKSTESSGTSRAAADRQALFDADYAKCLKYLDQPMTCTNYAPEPRTADEQAETQRCSELQVQTQERAMAATDNRWECPEPWQATVNPDGFDYPVSIRLGTTWVDWLNPRYRE